MQERADEQKKEFVPDKHLGECLIGHFVQHELPMEGTFEFAASFGRGAASVPVKTHQADLTARLPRHSQHVPARHRCPVAGLESRRLDESEHDAGWEAHESGALTG